MQAIAGLWFTHPRQADCGDAEQTCRMMLQRLPSRSSALSVATDTPAIALGVRSLSTSPLLPEDQTDQQPMVSCIPPILLVADLRLDNREELASRLALDRVEASKLADSALLFRAWQAWGEGCLNHIIGAFAFACWEGKDRRLFLARDHAGEKPLFFSRSATSFAFASMPSALRALSDASGQFDEERFADFLAVIPEQGTRTLFAGIERVPPGHCASITADRVQLRRYWHPMDAPRIRYRKDDEYIADFRERFDAAVHARLRSTQLIGTQLSGGLDSSSVSATAARLLKDQGKGLTAFTSVPSQSVQGDALAGRFGDEGPAAGEVAALYPNLEHVLVTGERQDLFTAIERGGRLAGQPVFNPVNQLWLDEILDQARDRGIGVMLQGVGGNLTISVAGIVALADMLRSGKWLRLAQTVRQLRAKGHTSWRGALSWSFGSALPMRIRRLLHPELKLFDFSFSPVHPDLAAKYRLRERALDEFYSGDNSAEAALRKLYEYYDPGVFNMAAAAGWEVEYRDPTQDKRIYEFCYGIPIEQYLAGGQTRSLIRRAMEGRLPAATLARTQRGLQGADWYVTLGAARGRMAEDLSRIERSPRAERMLDLPRLRRLVDTWPSSGYAEPAVYDNYHLALSRGISAGHFIAAHDPEIRST